MKAKPLEQCNSFIENNFELKTLRYSRGVVYMIPMVVSVSVDTRRKEINLRRPGRISYSVKLVF
jgi:hypothetical protein